MAKKNIDTNTSKKQTLARVTRTEAYAENVRVLFAKAVNEILALNKQIPTLSDGEMFSFDAQSQKMQTQVENVLRKLHAAATLAIKQGVKLEWDQANEEVDKLLTSVMGKRVMSDDRFNALTGRNTAALNAFLDRSEKGMKLSDRVWKPVKQLRDEMEVALTVSIGEGESAANMSRKVREYLNDPDLMFRRFRYKAGEEKIFDEDGKEIGTKIIWGRKWKKRVRDANGKVHFIDYDKDSYKDQYTGKGYYKSSAQNAMRVTRTETNIAYRRADHARWNDLDFVLGVRVQPSKKHKKSKHGDEICEKLAGDYPKDFVFDGWHPQCYCFATPILMDESEMQKYADALAEGKTYTPKGKKITDYPQGFKDWCKDNESQLLDAHDNGRDPYFVRNNYSVVERVLNGDDFNEAPKMSPLEIAKQRHDNRTPEQVQEIQNRAKERQDAISAGNASLEEFKDLSDIDTSELQDAMKHANWTKVQDQVAILTAKKNAMIAEAQSVKSELAKIKDIDTDAVEEAIQTGDLAKIRTLTQDLNDKKQQITDLKNIEDPMSVAEQFSMQDAISVDANIQKFFDRYSWNFDSDANLQVLKKGLEHEITWMGTKGKKYATWEIAQNAYKKRLDLVNKRIDMKQVKNEISSQITMIKSSRSSIAKQLVTDFDALFADDNTPISLLRSKALEIKDKAKQMEDKRAKDAAKKAMKNAATGSASTGSFVPKTDSETKTEFVDYMKKIGASVNASSVVVDKGFVHLQGDQQRKLYDSLKPETAAEHKQLWNSVLRTQRTWRSGYVQTSNSFNINRDFRRTGITGDLDAAAVAKLKAQGTTDDDIKTMKLLDKKIKSFSLPVPILVTRYVEPSALQSIFGQSFAGTTINQLLSEVNKLQNTPTRPDPAYMSASTNETQNVFYNYKIKLQIEVPPNTPMYLTDNYQESEVVFGRSTKLFFKNAYISDLKVWGSKYTHLTIRCIMIYP